MSDEGKRRGLGRGLSALFGDDGPPGAGSAPGRAARAVSVELVHPGRFQPRRVFDPEKLAGLVDSIRDKGVLQPLLVRNHPTIPNAFELIAGERRWRAAQAAQLHEVPVIIRDLSDRDTLEIALVENLQREDLTPLDEAEAYRRLMDEFGHTQEDLARALGKSRSHVANTMRLLGLAEPVRALLAGGQLTAGHARALLNAARPVELAEEIVRRGLNVRQAEALVQRERLAPMPIPKADADTVALERELTGLLGLKVRLKANGQRGELVIEYRSLDQLDDFLRRVR